MGRLTSSEQRRLRSARSPRQRASITGHSTSFERRLSGPIVAARTTNQGHPLAGSEQIAFQPGKSRRQNLRAALTRVQKAYSSGPSTKGLDIPKDIAKLDVKIGRREHYPPSLLAAQQLHESGFDPGAVSSAGAGGISQFIPSTAASYGVKFGTDKKSVKSQIHGQARYMKDLGAPKDTANALGSYLGDHNPNSSYAQGILADQQKYRQLDKPAKKAKPKDLKTLQKAGIAATPGKAAPAKAAPPVKPEVAHRMKKIEKAANSVAGVPYVWGGGHGSIEKNPTGLDCSGAVSRVLKAAGVLKTPLTSGAMGQVLKPGPGAVTVYYNSGHTFMKIGNKFWGTSVGDSGSGGLGEHPAPSSSYLSEYNVGHVPGLGKKAAAAMGVKLTTGGNPGSTGSAGGGTSSGGSTTTVQGGVIKTAPGFSNHPIKALTPKQKLDQVRQRLGDTGSETTSDSSSTAAISRRHGKPVV